MQPVFVSDNFQMRSPKTSGDRRSSIRPVAAAAEKFPHYSLDFCPILDEERAPRVSLSASINLPGYGNISRADAFAALDAAARVARRLLEEARAWKLACKTPEIRARDNIFYVSWRR